jgi:hypothetical protein
MQLLKFKSTKGCRTWKNQRRASQTRRRSDRTTAERGRFSRAVLDPRASGPYRRPHSGGGYPAVSRELPEGGGAAAESRGGIRGRPAAGVPEGRVRYARG